MFLSQADKSPGENGMWKVLNTAPNADYRLERSIDVDPGSHSRSPMAEAGTTRTSSR